MNFVIRLNACPCAADQMPLSQGEIRPSGLTPLASTITRPAPPTARLPRCTKCQSVGIPSWLEYWHIGETKIRFLNSISLRRNFENKLLVPISNLQKRQIHFLKLTGSRSLPFCLPFCLNEIRCLTL